MVTCLSLLTINFTIRCIPLVWPSTTYQASSGKSQSKKFFVELLELLAGSGYLQPFSGVCPFVCLFVLAQTQTDVLIWSVSVETSNAHVKRC